MAKTEIYICQRCREPFLARVADRNRGWARFCSKSCKAIKQTQRTGYAGPRTSERDVDDGEGLGWDAHKAWVS
jgi:hypothetical protein